MLELRPEEVGVAVRSPVSEEEEEEAMMGGTIAGILSDQPPAEMTGEEGHGGSDTHSPSTTTNLSKLNRRPLSMLVNRKV